MVVLSEFGFGKAGIPQEYFEEPGNAIHLGVEPNRIDLLVHLKGISNERIFANRQNIDFEGHQIFIISFHNLMEAKTKSSRFRDHADADKLLKIRKSDD